MFHPTAPLATRILSLSGFPPELKTRDIQAVFSQWENERGGFKIKWVDDTNALIIFNDPSTAPVLMTAQGIPAKVRPYTADDTEDIISSVLNRPRSRSNATHDNQGGGDGSSNIASSPKKAAYASASRQTATSPPNALGHRRHQSGSNASLPPKPVAAALFDAAQGGPSPARHLANAAAAERARAAAAVNASDVNASRKPTETTSSGDAGPGAPYSVQTSA